VFLRRLFLSASVLATAAGCASGPRPNFNAVYPGMPTQQVVQAMQGGPTRAQAFPDGSSAWYYGEDQCVLVRDEKVITKDTTQDREAASFVGVASVHEKQKAFCAPEGVDRPKSQADIATPFGTVHNAGGIVDGVKNTVKDVKDVVSGDSK
jgi:hypothetical protein